MANRNEFPLSSADLSLLYLLNWNYFAISVSFDAADKNCIPWSNKITQCVTVFELQVWIAEFDIIDQSV